MATDKIPSARMIRAARGLLNIDQAELGRLVGVARRTIIRLEADEAEPTNPRRIEVVAAMPSAVRTACRPPHCSIKRRDSGPAADSAIALSLRLVGMMPKIG